MIRRILAGCWFDHSFLYERDAEGVLTLKCVTCGEVQPVLQQAAILDGPAHEPATVPGMPITKVVRQSEKTRRYPRRVG